MARIEKTVFISYRRADVYTALAVYQDLTSKGYDVFFDYTSIPSGDFEQIIVSNIKARAHFVLILTPTALDRCSESGDWLRREIETAFDEERNIIPLFFKGFKFGSPSVSEKLTGKLGNLSRFNGLNVHEDYFPAAMDRLSGQFLSVPLDAILQPYSTKVRERVKEEQSAAENALQQKWEEIKELVKPAKEKLSNPKQEQDNKIKVLPAPSQGEIISGSLRSKPARGIVNKSNFLLYGIGAGILVIATLGISWINSRIQNPIGTETSLPIQINREIPNESTLTSSTLTTPPEFGVGSADKIAFVANNEIWLMNVDGSDLERLTDDGGTKSDLQWRPDGETIMFISGKTIKYVNINTGVVDILTSFPSAFSLNAFRVSRDGKQVMISLSNQIFVVPFEFDQMKSIDRNGLFALNGCIDPEKTTDYAGIAVKEALWSADNKLVAWLFKGVDPVTLRHTLQVRVLDITDCDPAALRQRENFPAERFTIGEYQITDVDWDGNDLFVFNANERNKQFIEGGWEEGWGKLYVYNWVTHRLYPINPIDGNTCCYRDARWSPDGKYLFFAHQAYVADAPTLLYYVPYGLIGTGTKLVPLPLEEGFFKNPKEAPQPALRPVQQ